MFNAEYKRKTIEQCEKEFKLYSKKYDITIANTQSLFRNKQLSIKILTSVDDYIHSLSNKPDYLKKIASEILIRRKAFEQEIQELKIESKKVAISIATTFGTASTCTAIASLSGATATNAALACLGGGALSAGGGGIVAGDVFLALAGPVGWAIGGAGIVGGGLLASSKNKKIAEKAEKQTKEIKKEVNNLNMIDFKVCSEIKAITELNDGVDKTLNKMQEIEHRDYRKLTEEEKDTLKILMNSAQALSKRIGVKIS